MAILVILTSCASKKYVDKTVTESHRDSTEVGSMVVNSNITERTDNDKVKTIVITEYVTKYDTVYKGFPIKSVTEIREEDKGKSVKEDKTVIRDSVHNVVHEGNSVRNDIESTSKPSVGSYMWVFALGAVVMLILIIGIKFAWKYIKTQFGIWK